MIWTIQRGLRLKTRELGTLGSREQRQYRRFGGLHRWFEDSSTPDRLELRSPVEEVWVITQRRQSDLVSGGCGHTTRKWGCLVVMKTSEQGSSIRKVVFWKD